MELSVLNIKGEDTGRKVSLNEKIFSIEPNDHAIYLDVKQHLANRRQGTHKTKVRSEVTGSTRKLGRQKGGGGARPGDIKSPLRIGGGTIFGPVPRSYSFKLNKKLKQLARKSALSYKAKDQQITVVEDFDFDTPKTKKLIEIIKNLQVADKKPLIVLENAKKNVYLSARNIPALKVVTASELNTYILLNAKMLVLTENSISAIEKTFNLE
ncbi:MAG TPA: 50S ribosomal protein L4 [Paludibacteraceae bacterium]|nr:50S ribosomal protein L4 [Paludibacteraceae bacterium]HPO68072.1 50S ribosomal protein L4 [Paludibacteraceae bacterium]HRR62671.1 50S ribosomal protein L4 [Paludibacteraceae bacterium]